MNCIIIDGNITAQNQLIELIDQIPQLNLKASCLSPGEAISVLQNQSIDLIFLDTQLAKMPGIEFARSLVNRPIIIITAQNAQYAVDAFNIDAVDYLIKPLSAERFMHAIQKANEIFWLRKFKLNNSNTEETEKDLSHSFILLKADYGIVKITIDDILFIEGLKDYIKIYTVNNSKPIIVRNSLKKFSHVLPPSQFSRIHKSFIISISHITSINKTQVYLGDNRIPIGESYKNYFLTRLQNRMVS
ncbi:two component transcriptional regulator, LytTR family [Mariniphaga anaerophila]|uniref:Two component transcriptional regulator, LytTR family n=1 Tax=Mariniphaga anaerophila TaxID=1484053 RepID=A0A1M4TKY1_9BACT|nr:LytTR family DNA-binding domain-containing protein [Mariniphaga anaerophila]SHE45055.1 two component transcriptional regulator, LytTR family [Mariniphaga anaerophila]